MKLTAAMLVASSVAVASATDTNITAAMVTTSNTTTPAMANSSTNTTNGTAGNGASIQEWSFRCISPSKAAFPFWRIHRGDGPHECNLAPLEYEWAMLRSYRDGGIEGVHWKYTDNENDKECMKDWIYHAADGRTVKTTVKGRTTTYGLNRRWCGLPVYHDGGVEGYQWDYCFCTWRDE